MAQNYVLKDRSRDADSKKERSHMIRDPRQKMVTKAARRNAHSRYNTHYIRPKNSKSKEKVITFDDKDVPKLAIKAERSKLRNNSKK